MKGLNFVPTPSSISKTPILRAATEFGRKIKLNYIFKNPNRTFIFDNRTREPFTNKSNWDPPNKMIPDTILTKINQMENEIKELAITKEKPNCPPEEIKALKKLKSNPNIIIKKADKGTAVVIQDKDNYISEVNRQLSDHQIYEEIEEFKFPQTAEKIKNILLDLRKKCVISERQLKYLLPPPDPRPRRLYTLPKIHKPPEKWINNIPPGRPIVSDINSESYNVSKFIDHYLKPIATKHDSYIRDTTDFLNKLKTVTANPKALLVTLDVQNMYPSIPTAPGVKTVTDAFRENPQTGRPDDEIVQLLKLCLENNDFEFGEHKYLQKSGTAMGKIFAPNYCNIFMAKLETEVIARFPHKPKFWKRFLDDIFMIWEHDRKLLEEFLYLLNSAHPAIKFTAEIHENSADFLDVTVYKGPNFSTTGKLSTKMYFKPTDTHSLLLKTSFHPKHVFTGLIKSQIIRYYRNCTENKDFDTACSILFNVLRDRSYSIRQLRYIKSKTIRELKGQKPPPFLETNLPDYQVPPTDSETELAGFEPGLPGSRECGRPCVMCQNIRICHQIRITSSGEIFKIRHYLDCNSKNIIYVITCGDCKYQYVGETKRKLAHRTMLHRHDIAHDKPTLVANHFNHICDPSNFTICPIFKCPELENEELTTIKRRSIESYFIKRFKTYIPYGLNQLIGRTEEQIEIIPFCPPYSSVAKKSCDIVRKYFNEIQAQFPERYPNRLISAYSRQPNLSTLVTSSKLPQIHDLPPQTIENRASQWV